MGDLNRRKPAKNRLLRRAAFIALLLVANSSAVLADSNPFAWFTQFFHPQPQQQAQPPAKQAPLHKFSAKPKAARLRPGVLAAGKELEKPKIAPSVFVAVFGDGLAQMLSQGLTEVLETNPEIAVLHKTQDNSGLVRTDVADLSQMIQDTLAGGSKIDAGVILLGSNDRQPIIVKGKSFDVLSPQWSELYAQRIDAVASQFAERKIPLIWVGLPIMKSDAAAKDATGFNELFKGHVERFGGTYIDTWEGFADEHGLYNSFGPDVNGETIRLRRGDGVYFTRAGARKLAHFVELELHRQLDKLAPSGPLNPQPEPGGGPAGEPAPIVVAKPPIGPVIPLTDRFLAPDGALDKTPANVTSRGPDNNGEAKVLIQHVLQEGKPLEPKKGRADDFSVP